MPIPLFVINFKLVKDTHNVILILRFNSSSFFPGVPSSNYHGDPSKSLQGFTLYFQLPLSFRLIILLFNGVLHGGAT